MREVITSPLVGIFVGGASARMGGAPKGLLPAPDGEGSLVTRLAGIARSCGLDVVLVGAHPAYAALGLETIPDAAPDVGPLGGLVALLAHAGARPGIALACDLPFVDGALLRRLVDEAPAAPALAPRRDGRWEPLAARYDAARVLPTARRRLAAGALGLQGLLDELGAEAMTVRDAGLLDDWDRPEDVTRRTR